MKLARNTLLNLLGLGAPLLVAALSIPFLIDLLGAARFGLLTLMWAVVSYFGLFDLGLGRALTQQLSATLARGTLDEVGPVVGTACALMVLLGLTAGISLALLASWGVSLVVGVPDASEAVAATMAMACAVPAVVLTAGLRGVLEAQHAFGVINLIRLPLGLFTFLGPLAVAHWLGPRLDWIALALLLARLLALLAHLVAAARALPKGRSPLALDSRIVRTLLTAGGWLTLGNLVGPLIGYADRFIIAATVSASAVAFYATPHELVTKLWIIPGALTAVLFPAFAANAVHNTDSSWPLAAQGTRWVFAALLPITLALALFAQEALTLWIGRGFATESAPVLRLMAIGIFINCLAHVPLTFLQGAGHARAPALLQAAQVLPFVALMWWVTVQHGVIGAALLWLTRMAFDTGMMFFLCARVHGAHGAPRPSMRSTAAGLLSAASFAMAFAGASPATCVAVWSVGSVGAVLLIRPWQPRAA